MAHVDINENFTEEGIAKILEVVMEHLNTHDVKHRCLIVNDEAGNRKIITATGEEIVPASEG